MLHVTKDSVDFWRSVAEEQAEIAKDNARNCQNWMRIAGAQNRTIRKLSWFCIAQGLALVAIAIAYWWQS